MTGVLDSLTAAQQVEAIYVAYFGRAADGAGYLYWENAAQTMSPVAIADSFAVQPEAMAEYAFLASPPAVLNPTDPVQIAAVDTFINQVYQNLFNRAADAPGLAYWQGQILSGAVSIGDAVYSIANGASTPADQLALTDKIAAASDFTQQTFADNLGASAPLSASFLHAAEASVVNVVDAPSLAASEAATAAYINPSFTITDNAGGTVVPPSTTSGGQAAEGSAITFTVNAPAGVANGTVENYVLTGTGSALSQVSGALTGTVIVENGVATFTVSTLANVLGGADPTLTVTLSNLSGTLATDTVTINEAQQAVTPSQLSVNEGSSVNFTVSTSGVPGALVAGSTESYTITGAPGQIASADQSGSVTLGANGEAVVTIHTTATMFNVSSAPTFTLNLTNAGGVVSSEAVTLNETAIIASADSAGGTTTQGSFGGLITETTTGGTITDGNSVTFTISTSGVAGAAVAGTQETWSLAGSALNQIVGATSGTVTLDANGIATVTVQTDYSSNDASPFSGGDLVFSLSGLPVSDTVSVNLPALLYFTTAPNEVLLGGAQDTTFVGVVDSTTVGNNTMSNGEAAQGQAGFANTLDITVNSAATDVVPGSASNLDSNIQTLSVTDLNPLIPLGSDSDGTFFNLQFVPDLTAIISTASDVSFDDFFNIQNLVDVTVLNSDYSGQGSLEFDVVNSVAGGPVTVTLDNAGSFDFTYIHTDGSDFVTSFAFQNTGENGIDFVGAGAAQSITVAGTGSLWMSFDGDDNLYALTSVDASGLAGSYTSNYQFGFDPNIYNSLTFLGAQGNTFVDLNLEVQSGDTGTARGGTFDITTYAGNDHIDVNSYKGDGETITVNSGDGNTGSTATGSHRGGDSIDLHGWKAANQTLNVTVGDGNNNISIVSANAANVTVVQESVTSGLTTGDNDIDIDLWNGQLFSTASAAMVAVAVLDGTNNIHINTAADGLCGDVGSSVTVTAGDGVNNRIHVNEGSDSTTNITVGNGNGTDVHVNNDGGNHLGDEVTAVANITVGTGSDIVVSYHDNNAGWDDVTINLGDVGVGGDTGAGGNVWVSVGADSSVTENLGSGFYTIHDYLNGADSTVTITALDLAGGGNDIYVDLNGSDDAASITAGAGDNIIIVTDCPELTGDTVAIQTGSGSNTIYVDLSGVTDATVTVDAGNVPPTTAPSVGDNDITVTLDDSNLSTSSVTIDTGNGDNIVTVHGLALGSDNVVNVTTGSGNDWIYFGTLDTGASTNDGITVNAGAGYNTLALNGYGASITDTVALVAASIQGFQALELTSTMYTSVDLLDLGPNNNINQVILDAGYYSGVPSIINLFSPTITLSGLTNNAEIDLLWGDSAGSTLAVPIGNSAANPNDSVNLLLDSQAFFEETHHYGTVNFDPALSGAVHTVNLESTAALTAPVLATVGTSAYTPADATNDVAISDVGITTLNILGVGIGATDTASMVSTNTTLAWTVNPAVSDGDVYLNLSGSSSVLAPFQPSVIDADVAGHIFYAGIADTDSGLLAQSLGTSDAITVTATHTTYDDLVFGNHSNDSVALGNYENTVVLGNGSDDSLTMTHTTNVYGSDDGGNTVTVGTGSNDTITLGDTGTNGDTVTLGANHSGQYAGGGDTVTIGDGLGAVSNTTVTINGADTSGTAQTSIETITFNGTGGGNTVVANHAAGTTIDLGATHTIGDTVVFGATQAAGGGVSDSTVGYSDTILHFIGGTGGDTINIAGVIGTNTVSHGIQQASGALAVLALLNTDALTSGHDAVIYDTTNATLYDFHGAVTSSTISATNTFEVQLVGTNLGAGQVAAHNILI